MNFYFEAGCKDKSKKFIFQQLFLHFYKYFSDSYNYSHFFKKKLT